MNMYKLNPFFSCIESQSIYYHKGSSLTSLHHVTLNDQYPSIDSHCGILMTLMVSFSTSILWHCPPAQSLGISIPYFG